jgi:hypothetical protein
VEGGCKPIYRTGGGKSMEVRGSVLTNEKRPNDYGEGLKKREAARICSLYVDLHGEIVYVYR